VKLDKPAQRYKRKHFVVVIVHNKSLQTCLKKFSLGGIYNNLKLLVSDRLAA